MKALVTGASGVVGRTSSESSWTRAGTSGLLLRPGPPRRALLGLPVDRAEGDVLDLAGLEAAAAGWT